MFSKIVRPLRNGQITIPIDFRRQLGIDNTTLLRVDVDGGALRIRPIRVVQEERDPDWLNRLYDHFAPVRAEAIEKGYSETEIDAAIDAAVAASRADRRG